MRDIQTVGPTTNSSFMVTINGTSVTTSEADRNLIDAHFDDPLAAELCPFSVLRASRSPDCGNGVCEIGEPIITSNVEGNEGEGACAEDCDFIFDFCAVSRGYRNTSVACSGHGRCLFAGNASCDCYEGYTGDNCNECSSGHYRIDTLNFRCLPRQSYVLTRDDEPLVEPPIEAEEPALASGPDVEETSTSSLESPGSTEQEGLAQPILAPESGPSPDGSERSQDAMEADSNAREGNELNSNERYLFLRTEVLYSLLSLVSLLTMTASQL